MKKRKPILDKYCVLILRYILSRREIRFNELLKLCKVQKETSFSAPTLSNHLKHLIKYRLVLRKVEDVQNVTYRVNSKEMGKFGDYLEIIKRTEEKWKKTEEQLFSLSVDQQVLEFLLWNEIWNLEKLKNRILWQTYGNLGRWLTILSLSSDPYFRIEESLIAKKCLKDSAYREKILQEIENFQKRLLHPKGEK